MRQQFSPTSFEADAARELCRLRGIDPEEIVHHGPLDGSGLAVSLRSARWVLVAREIRDHANLHKAMEAAVAIYKTYRHE